MNGGESIDPTELPDVGTIWASPGLITDPARPDLGPVAVLALVPQITVHTADEHAGAEPIDLVVADLLRSGFGLVARLEPADLTDLPTLDGWAAQLDPDGQRMRIVEPDGTLYDGDLGAAPPPSWHDALHRRGRLVALFGSAVDIGAAARRIDGAAAAGGVVGAQLPVVLTTFDTE